MTWFLTLPIAERVLSLLLFALYIVTAVRLCRYSKWIERGAPNPFLPRALVKLMRKYEIAQMSAGKVPSRIFA